MSGSGNTKSNKTTIVVGILCAAIGAFPPLATLGLLPTGPTPSDPTPPWFVWLISLVFGCGGILVVIRGIMGDTGDGSGALPPSTPRLLRGAYDLLAVAIVCSLAMMFAWVAFGLGPRHFFFFQPVGC